ncbi:PAS domain-containing sensor histidine kinase [Promethearchaeum syntrophicum]|uniref:histidine kinase n=1 Tax=Promethearchaeum syntrophicum TaxID=2594042 RepID=A0A5B9DD88_9ARCH|nr:PAS domain-containing sensor histidine kinase [Candidatus Prometheoarchaeum syntrophicum]QEE16740.1 aerobic respiration control sensor protein ArcB [Candidatus Prometheoarchaeum syntrophicum]
MGMKFTFQSRPLKLQIKLSCIIIVIFTSIIPFIYISLLTLFLKLDNENINNPLINEYLKNFLIFQLISILIIGFGLYSIIHSSNKIANNQEKMNKQYNSDLKVINAKLQSVFKTSNEGFWESNNEDITIDVNPKMCEILGRTREEIIGRDSHELLTPDGKDKISFQHEEYRKKGLSSSYELSFVSSSSKIVNCIVNAAPIFDEFGEKIGTFAMMTDITYLKEAEEKLKKQIEKLDCLFEISRILSKPNITIPKLLHDSLPLILQTSQNPKKTFVSIAYDEFEYKSENFKETDLRISILDRINGKKLEIIVYCENEHIISEEEISLIKEIEERIRNEILRREIEHDNYILANIVENSNDAIISLNIDGSIISWNKGAENVFGYKEKEIKGKNYSLLGPENLTIDQTLIFNEVKNSEHTNHIETKGLSKEGNILDISVTTSLIKNQKGEITGISIIARDFTEVFKNQKLYQEQILKSSQFKSDFMSSMSHELRTPLNSIIGFSDVLLEKYYGELNDQQEIYLNNVKSSAGHLLNLINDILDISKIEAGKVELNIQKISIHKVLKQTEITLRPEFEKKNLKFEMVGLNSEQVVPVDLIRFKEILYNLLSNAIKYTKKGSVKLEVIEEEDLWKFNVIDTGIGIKEEHFDLIFNEFERIQSEYVSSVEGTGLGLSLTKRLVELHGGNISFTSKWEEGSIFTFTLPKK